MYAFKLRFLHFTFRPRAGVKVRVAHVKSSLLYKLALLIRVTKKIDDSFDFGPDFFESLN